ncbi:MAG: serine hydrolase [Bryobacteraceae bacterium]
MKHPARKLLVFLLLFSTIVSLQADEVDDWVMAEMKKMRIPGLSLAVVSEGRLVKSAGYGLANIETGTTAKPETVYKIASLSKPILATAVMLLVQQGKVKLDDKAARYLHGSPASWENITVRHLLSRTSGIVRDPSDYHPYKDQPPSDVIASAYSIPLQFQPGEKWLYSNIGYYVLAEIIGRASGKPWHEFVAEQLFEPAGMTATHLTTVEAIIPQRANGYENGSAGIVNAENWIAIRPSGAYISTVMDLAKWDVFMDSTRSPLSPSSRADMKTLTRLTDGKATNYGLGWNVDSFLGRTRIHHDGQYPGFQSDYERFEDDKLSIVVLANSGSARVERLALKIAGFYSRELVSPTFQTSTTQSVERFPSGKPAMIAVEVKNGPRPAPDSVIELEIWDESLKAIHKQSKTNESFTAGESKIYQFNWTPPKPGKYTINFGVYGPKWTPSYSWNQGMTTITVD